MPDILNVTYYFFVIVNTLNRILTDRDVNEMVSIKKAFDLQVILHPMVSCSKNLSVCDLNLQDTHQACHA